MPRIALRQAAFVSRHRCSTALALAAWVLLSLPGCRSGADRNGNSHGTWLQLYSGGPQTLKQTLLIDTAHILLTSFYDRIWLRVEYSEPLTQMEHVSGPVSAVEFQDDVDCSNLLVRDLQFREVGLKGQVVGDSVVPAPVWVAASSHPAFSSLITIVCLRLSALHPPRGA